MAVDTATALSLCFVKGKSIGEGRIAEWQILKALCKLSVDELRILGYSVCLCRSLYLARR